MDGVNKKGVSGQKTHPLVVPLCERLERWRREAGLETYLHLQKELQDALEVVKDAGVEAELAIFVIAMCEWWFRICRPSEARLRRTLKHRLTDSRYTPHLRFATDVFETSGVPSAINTYIDRQLAEQWDPEASEAMNRLFRERMLEKTSKLIHELARPFLVSEHRALPPRQGGYSDWGPWVAATAVHYHARMTCADKQDRRPVDAALAVVKALRRKEPDKSVFYKKRREIQDRAPELVEALFKGFQSAKSMLVQDKRIQPLLDEDCFFPLGDRGGWALLVGKPGRPEADKTTKKPSEVLNPEG